MSFDDNWMAWLGKVQNKYSRLNGYLVPWKKNISPEPTYYNEQSALCKDKNAMLALFQMLTYAAKELSTPVWLRQVRQIATEAKEALDEFTKENRNKNR